MTDRFKTFYKNNMLKWNIITFIVVSSVILFPIAYYNQIKISDFITSNKTFSNFTWVYGALLTLIFTAYQSIMARRQHIKAIELDKRNKAIELAKEYKSFLDDDISYLSAGMKNIGVADRMLKYDYMILEDFDKNEMDLVILKEDREYISNAIDNLDSQKLISVYCQFNKKYDLILESKKVKYQNAQKELMPHLNIKSIEGKLRKSRSEISKEEIQELKDELVKLNELKRLGTEAFQEDFMISSEFLGKIESTLNNLEWFSMHFKNGVADDDVVYQSLHQSFLETVRLLYTQIAVLNDIPYEKYFINTIWLYNNWKNKMGVKKKEHAAFKQKQLTERKSFIP